MGNLQRAERDRDFANRKVAGAPTASPVKPRAVDGYAATRIAAVLARVAIDQPARLRLSGTEIAAVIEQVGYRSITLASAEFVPPAARVHLYFEGGATARGDVERCLPRRQGFQLQIRLFDAHFDSQTDWVRIDPRLPVRIPCAIQVGDAPPHQATIVDVSRSGLRLQSPQALERGAVIEVTCLGAHIRGEVRYSREVSSDEFYIGVQADAASHVLGQTGTLDLTALHKPAMAAER